MRTCVAALFVCLGLFLAYPQMSAAQWVQTSGPAAPANITLSVGGQYLFAMGPPPTGRLFLLAKGALKWNDTRIRLSRPVNSLAKIGTALFLGTDRGLYLCENYVESPRAFKLKMPQINSVSSLVKSVRRLYEALPDATKVYPGHGAATDIGTEKRGNEEVSATSVNIKN